ncbi:unnamed protein product [Alopecurus aequalis]
MSPSPAQDDAPGSTASSCFSLAYHVWIPCLLPVVLVFSSVTIAAVFVVILPFACMAASLCLICAITAPFLAHCFASPDGAAERGVGSDNGGASSREEEEHEGEAEQEISCCQECSAAYAAGAQFSDPCGDEHEQFFWVDTDNYYSYRKFLDLLAFWRRKERTGARC